MRSVIKVFRKAGRGAGQRSRCAGHYITASEQHSDLPEFLSELESHVGRAILDVATGYRARGQKRSNEKVGIGQRNVYMPGGSPNDRRRKLVSDVALAALLSRPNQIAG